MPHFILIGLAAGLASAVLFASATAGSPAGRLLLFFLAPLPGFLAGLGWGSAAATISAVAAAVGCGVLLGAKSGLVVLLSQGIPVALLCYLAQLSRTRSVDGGTEPPPAEWYPVGRMVAMAALMAGFLAFLTMLLLGRDLDGLRALLRDLIEKVFLQQLPGLKERNLGEAEIAALTEVTLYAFPATTAISWLGSLLLNFYLAGRITLASGRLPRPWPDLAAITFPRALGFGLAAAFAVLTFVSGYPALLASGFGGAFLFAYLLMGLAIVHYVTRGAAARPFILWAVYLSLLVLNTWAGLALALLGALEPILPWRRWKAQGNAPD